MVQMETFSKKQQPQFHNICFNNNNINNNNNNRSTKHIKLEAKNGNVFINTFYTHN